MSTPAAMPHVGSTVHYVSEGSPVLPDGTQKYASKCRAAIITEVHDSLNVALCVLNPTGQFFREHNEYDAEGSKLGGTWHWWPCS